MFQQKKNEEMLYLLSSVIVLKKRKIETQYEAHAWLRVLWPVQRRPGAVVRAHGWHIWLH